VRNQNNSEKARISFERLDVYGVASVSLSPDGKTGAVVLEEKNNQSFVLVVDAKNYNVINKIKTQSKVAYSAEFLDNQHLFINSLYPVEVWDVKNNRLKLNFVRDGSDLKLSYQDHLKAIHAPYETYGAVYGIDTKENGNILLTSGKQFEIAPDGKLLQVFINNYGPGYDARYSPDGSMAAFAFHGEHLLIYDVLNNDLLKEFDLGGVPNGLRIIKFSQDGNYLAVGSDGATLTIVDLGKLEVVNQMEFSAGIFSLQWIDSEKLLVGTLNDLSLVDLAMQSKKLIVEHGVTALDAYILDGKLVKIAVGQYGGDLLVLGNSYNVAKKNSFTDAVRVQFNMTGDKLVATSESSTIVWDLNADSAIDCTTYDDNLWGMAFDKQRNIIYSGGEGGVIYRHDIMCKELN
jgi:WD40 repeat protein